MFWGCGWRPKFKLCGVWGDKMGWEGKSIFLNSVHINIFIKTKKEKGAWNDKGNRRMGEYGTLPILPDQKIWINFMVREEIKNDRRGWEREGSGHGPTRELEGAWAGEWESPVPVWVFVCFHLHPTVLGSSLVSVCRPYLTFCLSVVWQDLLTPSTLPPPLPCWSLLFSIYWELARSRILRS